MKRLATFLFAGALLAGCQSDSRLDKGAGPATGTTGTTGAPQIAAPSGDLEARVARLEADNAKYKEALDFLQKVYNQQKQQQQQQEEQEPDPSALFAVDITPDVQGGQVEGKNTACVTVIEAWDFA